MIPLSPRSQLLRRKEKTALKATFRNTGARGFGPAHCFPRSEFGSCYLTHHSLASGPCWRDWLQSEAHSQGGLASRAILLFLNPCPLPSTVWKTMVWSSDFSVAARLGATGFLLPTATAVWGKLCPALQAGRMAASHTGTVLMSLSFPRVVGEYSEWALPI